MNVNGKFSQLGLGLVEIMISITLGLMILAGVFQMYSTSSKNSRMTDANARIQENMRYTANFLQTDIAHAGNMGCFSFQSDSNTTGGALSDSGDLIKSFLTDNSGRYQWDRFVSGSNNVGPDGSDQLILRYVRPSVRLKILSHSANQFTVDTSDPSYQQLEQFQVVMAADCNQSIVFMITNDPSTSGGVIKYDVGVVAPADGLNAGQSNTNADIDVAFQSFDENSRTGTPMYLYAGENTGSFTYYIDDAEDGSTSCSVNNPESCALFREVQGQAEEIVIGVSNFQVNYVQDIGGSVSLADASTVSWSSLDRIQITLDFNSVNTVSTNVGQEFLQKTLTHTINLANQIE